MGTEALSQFEALLTIADELRLLREAVERTEEAFVAGQEAAKAELARLRAQAAEILAAAKEEK